MEQAADLDEALRIAATARIPTQNCVVADSSGRIGWTLMGPIPRRFGHDGRLPRSWAAGDAGWDGLLDPAQVPRVVDPPSGRLWTANNRVVDGEMLRALGDDGFALGARARQIRDSLMALERATAEDMLRIQLDDRALVLERWRDLLLRTLTDEAVAARPRRSELRRLVAESWTGHASIDSVGYRMVRAFRLTAAEDLLGAITRRCTAVDSSFSLLSLSQWEGPLWRLVTERPADEALLAAADRMLDGLEAQSDRPLDTRTWGERNTVRIQHPLSLAVPQLGRLLDLPAEPLPGDLLMPRIQSPGFGASERFVVSPGREEAGIFHMPGGQSGHFLSPYYRKGHAAWSRGEPTPFLPGTTVHRLTLASP
jgi:penicillin amidase